MDSYSLAERINSEVNASVTYKTDLDQYSRPEYWCEAGKYGDCEDYALLKRAYLFEQGFDADKVHIATCWINTVATNTGHCVLIVETNRGQFVLDNNLQYPVPLSFETHDYKYIWNKIDRGGKWYEFSIS